MKAFIGLMSGTSMDAVDAVLVSFSPSGFHIHATHSHPYPDTIRQKLMRLSQNQGTPDEVGEMHHAVGILFAQCAQQVMNAAGFTPQSIIAIGSHGQTIRHHPVGEHPFTLQIGDAALIAERTGVTTVADFRSRDIAAGGEGAPLVPAFHQAVFASTQEDRCILNLGGIANLTFIPKGAKTPAAGFDCGPANALMDAWCREQTGQNFDDGGQWALEGTIHQALLEDFLSDGYFSRPAPKSTGTEKFNLDWVRTTLKRHPEVSAVDVQRTLLELTAVSVADQLPASDKLSIFVCGGGACNTALMQALKRTCAPATVTTTSDLGLEPGWVEPTAFAWLASRTLDGQSGNLPAVTGAKGERVLGAIYPA